jgi:hypothetical protein
MMQHDPDNLVARCRPLLMLLLPALLSTTATLAASDKSSLTYEHDVRPILKQHCFHCHGEEPTLSGNLDLRLVRLMKQGGDSGEAIHAGDAAASLLVQRIEAREMPPDESKQITAAELTTIRQWIDTGAKTAAAEPETVSPGLIISKVEQAHWAFQPVTRPTVPEIGDGSQIANAIDAFLLAKLQDADLTFSPRGDAHTLLRRIRFDLHGLPPALEQLQTDVSSADAWAAFVDQLLESPEYGERWASHWLDVAGYADSEGYNDVDKERPHAWRYRDYVIRSLNADLPFDEFIRQQLAGDEMITTPLNNLSERDAELLVATGFLRQAPDGTGGTVPDRELARNDTIADTMQIVSTSLLGVTLHCAQCHDHRYDPISHHDYYAFRSIFDPALDWQQWQRPNDRLVSLYTDTDRQAAAEVEQRALKIDAERQQKQQAFIEATFERELAKLPPDIQAAARTARDTKPAERTAEQQALLKSHPSLNVTAGSLYLYDRKAADKLKQLTADAAAIRKEKPAERFVRALTEPPGHRPVSHVFLRGDHEQPGEGVEPAGLSVVSMNADLPEIPAANDNLPTSGRRTALARRLTHRNHPLTARVIVNRVWLNHFGRGLVTTAGDFGMLGEPPTHPELLDWLAAEFMDHGWSLKHLHRLILTSNAWQQSARVDQRHFERDPDNRLYGGAQLLRVDAEALRDSLLFVSGQLNPKRFGPPVPVMADNSGRFVIGKENLNAGRPGDVIDMQGEQYRRSIYVQVRRSRPLGLLQTFDRPEMTPNCDLRKSSTNSLQSLMLMNSEQMLEVADAFAARLMTLAGPNESLQIRTAWQLAYGRLPDESELQDARHFLKQVFKSLEETNSKDSAAQETQALAVLCQMLLSSNEFLYVN